MSAGRLYPAAKRAFDLAAAGCGVIVLAPVLLAVAAAVKLTSPGPVFYRGERIGYQGRPFRILKFRTMRRDAERMGTTTALGDPRITRIGHFLRRYKLDELPQLLNVLSGEMSLVGPRPEVEEHTREYDAEEQAILSVKPGITDYSSIHFVALDEVLGSEDPHTLFVTKYRAQKNQLRLRYVRNRSFAEDLRIIVATFAAIVGKARPGDARRADAG
ncbi:MAG TPA: sugar transferase [Longimicrobium sp.]|nr:sugar transferase [Longimicrobium sp.]